MDLNDLTQKLQQIDEDSSRRGVPILGRALHAFNLISPAPDNRMDRFQSVFDHIADWYIEKYGDAAVWDQTIGKQPVVIRGVTYVATIPFTDRNRAVDIGGQLKEVPANIMQSLTKDEFRDVALTCLAAFEDYGALYNLDTRPSLLSDSQHELVKRATFDLRAATVVLERPGEDTQGSITHSHQAAEKFIKSALLGYGVDANVLRHKFSHDLSKAHRELVGYHRKFNYVEQNVTGLDQLLENMDIRYVEVPRSTKDAVVAFEAARHVCGFIARQWQLDADRGGPDTDLQPGTFYRDYSGRTFRCVAIEKNHDGELVARLFALAQDFGETLPKIDAEFTQKAEFSYFYVELADPEAIRRLDARYLSLTRSRIVHSRL